MVIRPEELDEWTVLVPAPHVAIVEIDDGGLLVDEEAGRGYPVNATAALLWKLLDSVTPIGALIDDVSAAFDTSRPAVAESVYGLAQTFGHLGLFENVSRTFTSLPVDIHYADPNRCDEPAPAGSPGQVRFDGRYLPVPPNA